MCMKEHEISKWKVLHSEYLFRDPWLTVRRQEMLLPNGNIIPSYYILEYPAWVCTLALTKEGRMVLVRQYRPGLDRVSPELCAGVVDDTDASAMEAAQRELMEETGYGNGDWTLFMTVSANPGTHTNLTYCFLATGVEKLSGQHLEKTEDIAVELLEPEAVKKLLEQGEFMQAMHSAVLWKYFCEAGK